MTNTYADSLMPRAICMHRVPSPLPPFQSSPSSNSIFLPQPRTPCSRLPPCNAVGTNERRGRKQKKRKKTAPPPSFEKETPCDRGGLPPGGLHTTSGEHNFPFPFCGCVRAGCVLSCPRPNLPWQLEAITCYGTKPLACHHITVYASTNPCTHAYLFFSREDASWMLLWSARWQWSGGGSQTRPDEETITRSPRRRRPPLAWQLHV